MVSHHPTPHRSPLRRFRPMVLAIALATTLASVATVIAAPSTPASATAAQVTYSSVGSQPGALPSSFATGAVSDGWALAVSSTQLFNVSHHSPTLEVACHNLSDGSACWGGTQTITANGVNFATPVGAGLYLDTTAQRLYTLVIRTSDGSAGVVCIDVSGILPSYCGYTQLASESDVYYSLNTGTGVTSTGLSAPVQIGTSWYAFNQYEGTVSASGAKNTVLCFDLVKKAACTAQPYTVPLGVATIPNPPTPLPMAASGTSLFLQVEDANGSSALACLSSLTNTPCSGSWPVSLTDVGGVGGPPIPLNNTGGTSTGICLTTPLDPCWSLAGAVVTTPPNLAETIGSAIATAGSSPTQQALQEATGSPAIVNNSVYVPVTTTSTVLCYNFTTQKSCTNFPKALSGTFLLYTVNRDPLRPTCLWVNSDHGNGQIQGFDALTGGICARGPTHIQANSLVNPAPVCQATSFKSLQITSPVRSSYASASVHFEDATGAALPVGDQTLDAFGNVNLSNLNLTAYTYNPQFVVTLNGSTSTPSTVSYRLTWTGSYNKTCIQNGQSVSSVPGYWLTASDGGIFSYGNAGYYGSAGALTLNKPIVGMTTLANRSGYWLVASDGGIFSYGYARFHGSTGGMHLNKPIVGMAATPDGGGYWLVASDGGIFSFGDAGYYGSTGAMHLNKPIVGMAPTQDGGGYWLVASDGGIFSFGDAAYYGSTGAITLNKPIVGMAANPSGGGYWMVASDGGIFSFGNAGYHGSTGAIHLNKPIVAMSPTFDGGGYWMVASDGGIFAFGDAAFVGSAGSLTLNRPIVSMAS